MFEKARAAAVKAMEHLDAADVLAKKDLYGQAYAHLVLGLEESSVAGLEMIVDSGLINWESPPPWFKFRQKDLSRPGMHRNLLRLGLTFAVIRSAFSPGAETNLTEVSAEEARRIIVSIPAKLAEPIPKLFSNPAFVSFLEDGDQRKNAAFYSQPFRPASPPGKVDYRELDRIARPFILAINEEWPTEKEFELFRPMMEKLVPTLKEAFDAQKPKLLDALKKVRKPPKQPMG